MIQVYLLEVGDIRCRMEETALSGDNPVAAQSKRCRWKEQYVRICRGGTD